MGDGQKHSQSSSNLRRGAASGYVDPDFDVINQGIVAHVADPPSQHPAMHLWRAVIFQAMQDVAIRPKRARDVSPHREAVKWFFSEDPGVRADFQRVCDFAGVDSQCIINRAGEVKRTGLQQRAPHGTAKNYQKRRARYLKSRFAVGDHSGIPVGSMEFSL